ncbi:MAG: tyrosine-type recombinase/integrase [Acidimicrobiales bacterium]
MAEGPMFAELITRFLHDFGTRKPSPNTVAAYRRDLQGVGRRLAAIVEVAPEALRLGHLTKPALRQAFASWAQDHAAASIRRAWSAWSAFFDFLVAEDLSEGNPMAAVTAPRARRSRAKVIEGDDVAGRLLASAASLDETARHPWPARDVALVAAFLVTGIRLSEAIDLTMGSLGGPPGARRIAVTGKGDKTRTIPIEGAFEDLLRVYLEERAARFPRHRLDLPRTPLFVRADSGEGLNRQQVQYLVEKLYRRAGIRGRVPEGALVHALRHTFATSALDHGVDVVELQELLGHASLDTTRRYLDATAAQLRHAVASHPAQAALRRFVADQD